MDEWFIRRLVLEGVATVTEIENMPLLEVAIWNHFLDAKNDADIRAQIEAQRK